MSSLIVYPNPAQDVIKLYWGIAESTLLELYDVKGQRIFTQVFNSAGAEFDLSEFENGIYQLKVHNGSVLHLRKLVKAR